MRNDRSYRGRGRGRHSGGGHSGGRHSGGRDGDSRGRRDSRGGRGGRHHAGGRRSRRPRSSDPRQSSVSGNQRERIAVESGQLVLIDQFMLANPQFLDKLLQIIDDNSERKTDLIQFYGGQVVDLTPGTYRIERDPFAQSIIIHPEDATPDIEGLKEQVNEDVGQVFVDTRCVAMVDRELLDDNVLLQKYQQLWFSGQDKACRDLLRDNGGAVRYGFHREGDELGVYSVPGEDVVLLCSDVNESQDVQSEVSAG
jgi:hypothetical protein